MRIDSKNSPFCSTVTLIVPRQNEEDFFRVNMKVHRSFGADWQDHVGEREVLCRYRSHILCNSGTARVPIEALCARRYLESKSA